MRESLLNGDKCYKLLYGLEVGFLNHILHVNINV